jgi:hypothetical protein
MVKPQSPLYLTALTVIANILIHLWLIVPSSLYGSQISMAISPSILEGLMYQGESPTFSTSLTPQMLEQLNPRQLETISATQTANQLLSSMEGKGRLSDVSDFMTNVAMQESRLGGQTSEVSYSPFQIDPIGYKDFVERAQGGYGKQRVDEANKFLQDLGYGEDFDIAGFSFDKNTVGDELRDPLVGALVARMKFGSIAKDIPIDLEGQADYWKDYWNTKAGAGKPEEFMNQVQYYNSVLGIKTYDDTPIK